VRVDPYDAIVTLVVEAQAVAAFTKFIGEAVRRCPVNQQIDDLLSAGQYQEASLLVDGARTKTHLYHAFRETTEDDAGYGMRKLQEDEIDEYLSGDDGCEHCLQAFSLICRRKEARRTLGIAKRAIRTIGNAEIKRRIAEQAP
jgi:hypothetical protein